MGLLLLFRPQLERGGIAAVFRAFQQEAVLCYVQQ